MKIQKLQLAILTVGLVGVAVPSSANVIYNGSFEIGNFVPAAPISDNTMVLNVGATDMSGWTVVNASLAWIGPSNPFGLTASDGSYFLDLSGYHDNAPYGGVAQTSILTTIGDQYQLSLDLGTSTTYDTVPVSILVNAGSASTTFTSTPSVANGWEMFTFDFIATSGITTLTLTGVVAGDQSQKYIGLDNVSVVPIPEPGTFALFAGSGLLALVGWRRFRKA
jgi:hypothetical protein